MTSYTTAARSGTADARPVRTLTLRGGGGTGLHVREWGDPSGPAVVFVHGWSQSDVCWHRQVAGALARDCRIITFDLRGHGSSEKPADPASYTDPRLWADDLAAVLEGTRAQRPVLVAWSYGGFVVADYLRVYGESGIAALDLVGAAVLLRPPGFAHIGPAFLEAAPLACSDDPEVAITATVRFLRACTAAPLDGPTWDLALASTMLAPPGVRAALLAREIDADDVLADLTVPVLVTHGARDAIVLPSMAEHTLAVCPTARASWYADSGHMPFVEEPDRFDRELAALLR
jgi:pimeloyl-ACP methyl ester carboxylesterase